MKKILFKILFPFVNEKYELEKKWWHRLIKVLFVLLILLSFFISIIALSTINFKKIVNPEYNFKGGRFTNQALLDVQNLSEDEFNKKYISFNDKIKNAFSDLRVDLKKENLDKLKPLYPELFEVNYNFYYYIFYYCQIFIYTFFGIYLLSLILQFIYYKMFLYIIYGNK